MNKLGVIAIGYRGKPMREEDAAVIALTLQQLHLTNDIKNVVIKFIDHDSVLSCIAKSIAEDINSDSNVKVVNIEGKKMVFDEALEAAIILVGTVFKDSLRECAKTGNYHKFAMELMLHCPNDNIAEAIEMIATRRGNVRQDVIDKYCMTPGAIEVIRDVYGSVTRFH